MSKWRVARFRLLAGKLTVWNEKEALFRIPVEKIDRYWVSLHRNLVAVTTKEASDVRVVSSTLQDALEKLGGIRKVFRPHTVQDDDEISSPQQGADFHCAAAAPSNAATNFASPLFPCCSPACGLYPVGAGKFGLGQAGPGVA